MSAMNQAATLLIERLKAAGEPTRLRILALLRRHDLSVGELVEVLEQSQPRLSHHLKVLAEVGLAERLPEGAFVFYGAPRSGPARELVEHLFAQAPCEEDEFAADATRLDAVIAARAKAAEAYFSALAETWDTVRALHFPNEAIEAALLDFAGPGPFQRLIDFGTGTGRMLQLFAARVAAAEGIDFSHRMLTVARANLARAGIEHARVRHGDVNAVPFEDASADLVIVHQVLHFLDRPGRALAEAARVLAPGGRLLVVDFAPHDLEFLRSEHGHRRLGVRHDAMSGWCRDVGLVLEAPRVLPPPAGGPSPGLTVNIWRAVKPARKREKAA